MEIINKDQSFLDYLEDNVVLFDGAMGTLIYQRGIFIDKCYDSLNLSNTPLIESIHEEYIAAGSVVIETNTFGGNRFKLRQHNLQRDLQQINTEGARIAKRIIQNRGYVAGSIGPLGVPIKPWGEISLEQTREAFLEQAEALLEGNVDLFTLETFQNLDELHEAVRAIQSLCDLPIITQMAIQEDGRTYYGTSLEEFIKTMSELNVAGIGLNCALGPKPMLDFLEQMSKLTSIPISIMPNAGLPQAVDGRMIYMSTPDYFGVYTKRFIESGASIVGGCCGTTPEHIRKMASTITQKQSRLKKPEYISIKIDESTLPKPVPVAEKSLLSNKISNGDFVILMEMIPPRGRDLKKQIEGAHLLKESGVNAVNIPDGPRASSRMNGLAMAVHLQETIGIETVLHYTCRDKNLLGIQSELLGASVLGIKNILAITGDPPMIGDYPQSTAVFDIDSIGLTRILRNMNSGLDLGQKQIGLPTGFFIGTGVDPNSINLNKEFNRFKQKVEAGTEFVITQPVFDLSALKNFMEKVKSITIPFIAGIWPLVSLRNAEFMRNEVPGVFVPEAIIKKLSQYDQQGDQLKVGIEIAQNLVAEVRDFTQGIQVSAPFGRFKEALKVTESVSKKS